MRFEHQHDFYDSPNTDLNSAWMAIGLRSVFDESTLCRSNRLDDSVCANADYTVAIIIWLSFSCIVSTVYVSTASRRMITLVNGTINNFNTQNSGIGFYEQNGFSFLTFLTFERLLHESITQYQACLFLSECIFHCGFKYGQEISKC